MAAIEFNDGVLTELRNATAVPGTEDRFFGFLPDGEPIGPSRVAVADGRTYRWEHRKDQTARMQIAGLKASQMAIAVRLKIHLMNGGQATVKTEDLAARTYTVYLAPEATPEISGPDDELKYAFTASVMNSDPAVTMLCVYRA